MKLLYKTFSLYLIIAIPALFFSLLAFFYFLQDVITQQVDASLLQDKCSIEDFVNNKKDDVTELYKNIACSYYIVEIPQDSVIFDNSRFVTVYDSVYQTYEPVRELRSSIIIKEKNYEIVLHESFVTSDSVIYSISSFALVLIISLIVAILIVQIFVSKRIWEPFTKTLQKISQFNPTSKIKTEFPKTSIDEFSALNEALGKMTNRIDSHFERQRIFIDNVSHELQTPISVINTQLELLIQEITLKENSAKMIGNIDNSLVKMRRTIQTLLLLSKIENDQFIATQKVTINELIDDFLSLHQEQIELKMIAVEKLDSKQIIVDINTALAEILISNLLNNAINHNVENGFIRIETTDKTLRISNSGMKLTMAPEMLFQKFIHDSNSSLSSGLGLSIVKEICNYFKYKALYFYNNEVHTLQIEFQLNG